MDKILCGPCAFKNELSLEDRVKLAQSRRLGEIYSCPDCNKLHSWSREVIAPITEVTVAIEVPKPNDEEPEQLSLFDPVVGGFGVNSKLV